MVTKKKRPKLTPKQERFVAEYLVDMNGARAARAATYAPASAHVTASQLLSKPNIQAAIREGFLKKQDRSEINADFVLKGLRRNLERSMQEVPVLDGEGVPVGVFTYQGNVANRALELLGKNIGMFESSRTIDIRLAASRIQSVLEAVAHRCEMSLELLMLYAGAIEAALAGDETLPDLLLGIRDGKVLQAISAHPKRLDEKSNGTEAAHP